MDGIALSRDGVDIDLYSARDVAAYIGPGIMVYFGGGIIIFAGGDLLFMAADEVFTCGLAFIRDWGNGVFLFCRDVRMYY